MPWASAVLQAVFPPSSEPAGPCWTVASHSHGSRGPQTLGRSSPSACGAGTPTARVQGSQLGANSAHPPPTGLHSGWNWLAFNPFSSRGRTLTPRCPPLGSPHSRRTLRSPGATSSADRSGNPGPLREAIWRMSRGKLDSDSCLEPGPPSRSSRADPPRAPARCFL